MRGRAEAETESGGGGAVSPWELPDALREPPNPQWGIPHHPAPRLSPSKAPQASGAHTWDSQTIR